MDNECGLEQACVERTCINPCTDACGIGALCRVINHKPQCSCPRGYNGDANTRCIPRKLLPAATNNSTVLQFFYHNYLSYSI